MIASIGRSFLHQNQLLNLVRLSSLNLFSLLPFADLPEAASADANSVYEDVCNGGGGGALEGNDCVTIISVTPSFLAAAAAAASTSGASNGGGSGSTTAGATMNFDYTTPSEASSDRGSFTVNSQDGGRGALKNGGRVRGSARCKGEDGSGGDHTYENLEFHRVKISVPGHNGGKPFLLNNAASGCLDRRKKTPLVNSRVIRRGGRVKGARPNGGTGHTMEGAAAAAQNLSEADKKRFEKFGYSRNEVWNWLYTDEEEPSSVERRLISDLYSVPEKRRSKGAPVTPQKSCEGDDEKTVEVKFTPVEFLDR